MHLRSAALRLLPVALLALAACTSDSSKTTTVTEPETAAKPAPAPVAPDTVAAAPAAPAPDTADVQNIAAYLGGQRPSAQSDLLLLTERPAWQAFAKDQDKSWLKYTTTHTAPMTKWAATELDSIQQNSPTIFYPFSGPDFLNVVTMFPRSETYVMIGLEPVGSAPARSSLENPRLFPAIKASLWSVLNFSFFRTNDMAVDLKSVELDGAVPLIMLFAARTGHQILSVRPVKIDAAGQLQDAATPDSAQATTFNQRSALAKPIPGAEVKLRAPDGHAQTIYYFSADLSDAKLARNAAPLAFVRSLGPLTTYLKSASYLMHKSYFNQVRRTVLRRSRYLLQDDSGIAMKYFQKGAWNFTHYGTYRRPINLFAKHYQPELTAAYKDTANRARPLPFGTGYNWRQTDSNLMLAKRRIPLAD